MERGFQNAKLVATEIKLTLPKNLRFRMSAETPTSWSGFITPRNAPENVENMILVNVQEREGTVTIYVSHYAGGGKATAIRSNWTDADPVHWDFDRYIASDKTLQDLYNYIDLHQREMFEAFRAGNRARKKETVQDTVEGVGIDWNKAVQNIFDETEETNLRSGSYMKDMLPEKLAPVIEKMPGVASVSVKNSFWGGKELLIMTPDHPDHRKIDGRFDIFLQPVYTRSSDGDTNLGATLEAVLVFGYHDPDEITVNDFKYKWRSEIGRFSPLHTDRWGEALARICDFAGNSGFDMLDRLMTLEKWANAFRPFLGPDSITSTFRAMNMDLFKDNIISCMSGSSWNVMLKAINQLETEGK